jgi:hypothetical protein
MIFAPTPESQQNKVKVVVCKSGANDSSVREDKYGNGAGAKEASYLAAVTVFDCQSARMVRAI